MEQEPTEGIDPRVAGRSELLQRLVRDERGAFAVLFAVLFPVLVGILALGVEAGIWWQIKRQNQAVAHVAAYSGALEVAAAGNGGSGAGCSSGTGSGVQSACLSAYNDALTNGFDFANSANANASLPSLVCAGTLSGSTCTADNTHVTVKLVHEHAPMLASYFNIGTFPIVDVAVANVQSQASCASSVGSGNLPGLIMNGNPDLQMPDCTLTSNSTSRDAIDLGGNTTLDAFSIYTSGGIRNVGSSTITLQSPATTGGAPLADPYCKSATNCLSVPAAVTGFAAMPTLPTAATTFPSLPTTITSPPTNNKPGIQAAPSASCNSNNTSSATIIDGSTNLNKFQCFSNASGVTFSTGGGTINFKQSTNYSFTGTAVINSGVTVNLGNNTGLNFSGSMTNNGSISVPKGGIIYVGTGLAGDLTNNGTISFAANNGKNVNSDNEAVSVPGGNFNGGSGTLNFTGDTGAASNYAVSVKSAGTITLGTTNLGGGNYGFYGGAVTLSGIGTFATANYYTDTGNFTISGTARFDPGAANSSTTQPTNFVVNNGNFSSSSGGTVTFCGSSNTGGCTGASNSGIALSATSYSLGGTVTFGQGAYGFYGGGDLTLSGTTTLAATSSANPTSIAVVGNLNNSGTLTFTGGGTSRYDICNATIGNGGSCGSNSGKGVVLAGTTTFNAGTYHFENSSSSGSGLTLNGTASFAAGIYALQNGGLTINSGATALFSQSSSPCSSGSCVYVANGNISNAGTASFATGNYYLYAPNGSNTSFSNTGTLTLGTTGSNNFYINNPGGAFVNAGGATINFGEGQYWVWDGVGGNGNNNPGGFASSGALNFTGGCTGAGTGCSNYYFFNAPSFGTGNNSGKCSGSSTVYGALSIMAGTGTAASTANFGPGDYYIVNGDLCLDQTSANGGGTAPVLNCTNCAPGGAGVTFILTASGANYPSSVSTFRIPGDLTTNTNSVNGLNAPNGYPDGTTTSTCGRLSHAASGCYAGILFLQDPDYSGGPGTAQTPNVGSFNGNCPNHSNCSDLEGGANMIMTGAAYMPESVLTFKANSATGDGCLTLIAQSIIFTGNSSLDASGCRDDGVATVTSASIVLIQ